MLPLICYEAIFPQDVRAAPGRPDWLLQVTNDAWFGTFQGPYQHLAQARLRGGRDRAADGPRRQYRHLGGDRRARRVLRASLALGAGGDLDVALPAALPPTLYARTGDLPLALLVLVAAAGRLLALTAPQNPH